MPLKITTEVTYVSEKDLRSEKRDKSILDIDLDDLIDINLTRNSPIIILKIGGKYKLLKSRY